VDALRRIRRLSGPVAEFCRTDRSRPAPRPRLGPPAPRRRAPGLPAPAGTCRRPRLSRPREAHRAERPRPRHQGTAAGRGDVRAHPAPLQGRARLRPVGPLAAPVALLRADRGIGQGLARGGGHGLPVREDADRARLTDAPAPLLDRWVLGLSKPERFVRVHARVDGLVPQLEHGRVSMHCSCPGRASLGASTPANPAGGRSHAPGQPGNRHDPRHRGSSRIRLQALILQRRLLTI